MTDLQTVAATVLGYVRPKHYLLTLICRVAPDNGFAQDALEWACQNRSPHIKIALTGNLDEDERTLMLHYDMIIAEYRARTRATVLLGSEEAA